MACCSASSKGNKNERERKLLSEILQGIITANGFFSAAVFFGITGTVTPSASVPQHCIPGDDIVQSLFLFEVLSFCFYLVSSLVALGMKLAISRLEATDPEGDTELAPHPQPPHYNPEGDTELAPHYYSHFGGGNTNEYPRSCRMDDNKPKKMLWGPRTLMRLSAVLSLLGSLFLMLSMVDVIQLKLGLLSCGGMMAVGAVLALTFVVLVGIIVYAGVVFLSLNKE